jgi:ankyrin repeat protein
MIDRKDIVKGAIVQLTQELILINDARYEEVSFPANTQLKIKSIAKDKNNPLVRFLNGKESFYSRFDHVASSLTLHTPATDNNVKSHEKALNQVDVLKKIKKIAVKDDLEEILKLVDDEYFQSIKNVKTLMMYAIKSRGLKILKYGFEHNWFKKIDYSENIAIGETVASPLYYALLKSSIEVSKYLIEQGASMNNPNQKDSNYTITQMLEYLPLDDENIAQDLIDFEQVIQERKNLSSTLESKVSSKNKSKI